MNINEETFIIENAVPNINLYDIKPIDVHDECMIIA